MTLRASDVVFVAEDVVFFITDAASELCTRGFWRSDTDGEAVPGRHRRLALNDELITMTLILPGTHRLRFRAGTAARLTPERELSVESSEPHVAHWDLVLPTGRVVVRSDGRDAEEVPAITVEPGSYYVSVEWDVGQESSHHLIERVEDYPAGDGPDGVVTLVRKGPVRQTSARRAR